MERRRGHVKSLLVTLGSAGDVHPYVAIGVELRRRGHEVTVLTNPHFERRIVEAGLAFRGVGTEEDYLRVLLHPDLVHAHKSPGLVVRELMAATLGPLWEETRTALAEIRPDVMLRHHICFSARWAAEEAGVPCATGVLSPLFFFGAEDPGVYHPWMPEQPPRWMNWLRRVTTRRLLRWRLDRPMNRALRERGLPSRRDLFLTECTSGRVLGLWSPTFRAAMADDPPGSSVCGFCFFDRGGQWEERGGGGGQRGLAALREFLDACEARGEAPVLVTLGSSVVHHGRSVYAIAAEVLAEMRVPGVLLCGDEVVEGPGVRGFAYAPYSMVMPRARAVIHHGGVGTTAQGLLSGRPTVILPHANDAFDNAARAARLGCSITVKPGGLSVKRLGEAVRRVTTEASFAARAREVSLAMRGEDGAARAADQLERLAG